MNLVEYILSLIGRLGLPLMQLAGNLGCGLSERKTLTHLASSLDVAVSFLPILAERPDNGQKQNS
jgi:hypothetical protein